MQPKTKFSWQMICNAGKLKHFMATFEHFFVNSVQVWLKAELRIDCRSDFRCRVRAKKNLKIKIPFQNCFYPFRCMFKIMKGYKNFAFTPSGKSLKKTLPPNLPRALGKGAVSSVTFPPSIFNFPPSLFQFSFFSAPFSLFSLPLFSQ